MTLDEYRDDPWYDQYEPVPECLRAPLRVYGNARRFDIAFALAEELGLRTSDAGISTWKVVHGLVPHLAQAVSEGQRVLDDRPIAIAKAAVAQVNLQTLARATVELGWGRTQVSAAIVDLLPALRQCFVEHLISHIQRMMLRWEHKGLFQAAS